jgi:hypothetical protein
MSSFYVASSYSRLTGDGGDSGGGGSSGAGQQGPLDAAPARAFDNLGTSGAKSPVHMRTICQRQLSPLDYDKDKDIAICTKTIHKA